MQITPSPKTRDYIPHLHFDCVNLVVAITSTSVCMYPDDEEHAQKPLLIPFLPNGKVETTKM